jgi:hypothetical protein
VAIFGVLFRGCWLLLLSLAWLRIVSLFFWGDRLVSDADTFF